MNVSRVVLVGLIVAALAAAYEQPKSTAPAVNRESPQGKFLELISLESDEAKRAALIEQFITIFPKTEVLEWAYGELQAAYRRTRKPDKVLELGEKLLALNPDNFSAASLCWSTAESAMMSPEIVKKWSDLTSEIALRVVRSAVPVEAKDVGPWRERVKAAGTLVLANDESAYVEVLGAETPEQTVELANELIKRNPESPYSTQVNVLAFLALKELGDDQSAAAVAEKLAKAEPARADVLEFLKAKKITGR